MAHVTSSSSLVTASAILNVFNLFENKILGSKLYVTTFAFTTGGSAYKSPNAKPTMLQPTAFLNSSDV